MRYFSMITSALLILFFMSGEVSAGFPPQHDFLDSLLELWDLVGQVFGS